MALVTKSFSDIITFTRASTATYFNSAGVLTSAAINAPRFDYNPATLAAQGLLIEEQRTNLQVNSEDFTNVDWSKGSNATITANQSIAPDGALTADRFGYTSIVSGVCQVSDNQTKAASAITYTGSIYVKASSGLFLHFYVDANSTSNSGRVVVNTSNWTVFSSTNFGTFTGTSGVVTAVGNGWYRITCTTTSGTETNIRFNLYWSTSDNTVTFTPVGTENVFIWGAQLEAGAFPTSYIPTTTTALTRSADVASVNTLSPWYNQTEGTVYAELQSLSPLTAAQSVAANRYPHVWHIEAGASDSNLLWYGIGVELYIANTYNGVGAVPTGINKFAVSLAASGGQSRSSLNGAAAINRSGTLTGTATAFSLGKDFASGATQFLNGYLRRLTYYPRALSAAELQAITV